MEQLHNETIKKEEELKKHCNLVVMYECEWNELKKFDKNVIEFMKEYKTEE